MGDMKFFYVSFLLVFLMVPVFARDLFYLPEKNASSLEGVNGRLIGIISCGKRRACLLADDVSGVSSHVEEGMMWCGYNVKIRKRSVVLEKSKEKRVLFLN